MIFILEPLINVYLLSSFTILFGYVMDFTVSSNTLEYYCKEKPKLYIDGIKSTMVNLLIIAPINYIIIFNWLNFLISTVYTFSILKTSLLVLTHNILYFLTHMAVHRISSIRFIHDFHHKFKINLPSIGNAVSVSEFQIMYVLPFLLGSYIFSPSVLDLNISVLIISFLNVLIHCDEFKKLGWVSIFVSPKQHCQHHDTYHSTYSAPLLNFDLLLNNKKLNNKRISK